MLRYVKFGTYTGFGALGFTWQRLENPTLRSALKMPTGQCGVMVKKARAGAAGRKEEEGKESRREASILVMTLILLSFNCYNL